VSAGPGEQLVLKHIDFHFWFSQCLIPTKLDDGFGLGNIREEEGNDRGRVGDWGLAE
jgi:hypothetical protein